VATSITNVQAEQWILELRKSLGKIRRRRKITDDELLSFLSEQYNQLYLIHRAIAGDVVFIGAPPIGDSND